MGAEYTTPSCKEDEELDSWYEPGSSEEVKYMLELGKDYVQWFEDFTRTARGNDIVGWYNRDWMIMHTELARFFRNEKMLKSYDEDDDPWTKIDVDQRDNFTWQFRAWIDSLQRACPNNKLYFGPYYGFDERLRYERFFFKHHWDPEKTVDESVLEELKKQYNFDYNAM